MRKGRIGRHSIGAPGTVHRPVVKKSEQRHNRGVPVDAVLLLARPEEGPAEQPDGPAVELADLVTLRAAEDGPERDPEPPAAGGVAAAEVVAKVAA